MEILERSDKGLTILTPVGRLDAATSDEFASRVQSAIQSGAKAILVDMARLDYISSSGLRVFLLALKRLNVVEGRLALAALKDHVREVFDLAGFSTCFSLHATVEEAANSLADS